MILQMIYCMESWQVEVRNTYTVEDAERYIRQSHFARIASGFRLLNEKGELLARWEVKNMELIRRG